MKKYIHLSLVLLLFNFTVYSQSGFDTGVGGNSALDQLHNLSGGYNPKVPEPHMSISNSNKLSNNSINSRSTISSSPQMMLTGIILQSFLDGLFNPPTQQNTNTNQILEEQRQAELKRIQDSILNAHYNKWKNENKNISEAFTLDLKKFDPKYSLKESYVPEPIPSSGETTPPKHEYIELTRKGVITLLSYLGSEKYLAILAVNLIAEDIKASIDCFSSTSTYCPGTKEILKNALTNSTQDILTNIAGDITEKSAGFLYKSLTTKNTLLTEPLLNVNGFKLSNISDIGETYAKLVNTGLDSYDLTNEIMQTWGIK